MNDKFSSGLTSLNVFKKSGYYRLLEWLRFIFIVFILLATVNSEASENIDLTQYFYSDKDPEWGLYPEIKLGWRLYDYEAGGEKVFDVNFPSLKFSLFGVYDRFFAQGYYELSLGDGDGNVESAFDGSDRESKQNLGPAVNFKRTDWALLLGYRILPRKWEEFGDLGIFAGYKSGNSVADFKQFRDSNDNLMKVDYDLASNGAFLGLGAGIKVGSYGFWGVRVAYSWLDIDVTREDNYNSKVLFNGEGRGVSVGTTWVGSLTQKLQYTVGVEWHGYNYEGLKDSNNNKHLDIDESQISVRIGITYLFP